jgi:hypothetical protein
MKFINIQDSGIQETLYINSITGLKESILRAKNEPFFFYSDKIDWDNI